MRIVTAGSTTSTLIQVTQPSGAMYSQISGDRTSKVQTIYDWVMTSRAAQ